MNYKSLFNRIRNLLMHPSAEWEAIREEVEAEVDGTFVYPLIGLCALSSFIGTLWRGAARANVLYQDAMMHCCAIAIALFGSFFLSTYFIDLILKRVDSIPPAVQQVRKFVGYSMIMVFCMYFFDGLFHMPLVKFLLEFYTFYIVYEGLRTYLEVEQLRLNFYTIVSSLIILLCPELIIVIFNKLT